MIYQNSPLHTNLQRHHAPVPQPVKKPSIPTPIEQTLPQAINYCADFSGCGVWRMVWPQYVLNLQQKAVIHSATTMILDERFYNNISCVRVQRQATPQQKQFIEHLKNISEKTGMRIVYEVDDLIFREDIPEYNKFKCAFTSDEIRNSSQDIMMLCDEITVTCPFMKAYYEEKTGHKNITVIPNMPPRFWLDGHFSTYKLSKNYKKHCSRKNVKPRILYAGSGAHFDVDSLNKDQDDFSHVVSAIINSINRYRWVFIGAFPPALKPYILNKEIEFHPWQNIIKFPKFISQLEINCMVAPLQNNTFNKAKSDIKFVEASALGIPIVCQDMVTYENAHIKFKTGEEMISKIDHTLRSQGNYISICEEAHESIQDRWLEDNIDAYKELYTLPYGHKDRVHLNKISSL
jgi:O-antigen biosynthesis protein